MASRKNTPFAEAQGRATLRRKSLSHEHTEAARPDALIVLVVRNDKTAATSTSTRGGQAVAGAANASGGSDPASRAEGAAAKRRPVLAGAQIAPVSFSSEACR